MRRWRSCRYFVPSSDSIKQRSLIWLERIGTYKISIQPYEDCCTIFVPRHPETHPKLAEVEKAEEKLPMEELLEEALARTDVIICEDK